MNSAAFYAVTRQGAELALRTAAALPFEARVFLPERLAGDFGSRAAYFPALKQALAENFRRFPGHVVVGAAGMTVRLLAPLLESKKSDPAVVVLTLDGRYAVSLMSGHLGGGNGLAEQVAAACGGSAVLSTATDVEGLPALEMLARDLGLAVEDFSRLPAVSRRLAEGETLDIYDPEHFLLPGLAAWADHFREVGAEGRARASVVVDCRTDREIGPEALVLRPEAIFLGLGCHRGTDSAEIEELIDSSLRLAALAPASVAALATVETRREEPAFLEISRRRNLPLKIFTKAELDRVKTPNPSAKVKERIGVASVCEAAAMLAAGTDRLIIHKRKSPRATLAAALGRKPIPG